MSNKRKAKPNKISGHIGGIPASSASAGEAEAFQKKVTRASMLTLPDLSSPSEQGLILEVDKVGFLGDPSWILTGEGSAYLETTDATFYRLPADLNKWARDVVTTVLAAGGRKAGIFPTRIEFGRLNGRPYAEML
jgi:hypothetical protein